MGLNKQKGNMYPWVTHTWNPIGGECPHQCVYCYMQGHSSWEKPIHLREKFLRDNLGSGNTVFVGSATDMWAGTVPGEWIVEVLAICRRFNNHYLFQSKNPKRFIDFKELLPSKTLLGTTAETNCNFIKKISKAPSPLERIGCLFHLTAWQWKVMVSIEPILSFDSYEFLSVLELLSPEFISIGADSKGHNLPEPSPEKIKALIEGLRKFTEVKIKSNLKRLLRQEMPVC